MTISFNPFMNTFAVLWMRYRPYGSREFAGISFWGHERRGGGGGRGEGGGGGRRTKAKATAWEVGPSKISAARSAIAGTERSQDQSGPERNQSGAQQVRAGARFKAGQLEAGRRGSKQVKEPPSKRGYPRLLHRSSRSCHLESLLSRTRQP